MASKAEEDEEKKKESTPSSLSSAVKLNSGSLMPMFGLGTYQQPAKETVAQCLAALENGYRLIDTAALYRNEKEVGAAVNSFLEKNKNLKREDLFITTKMWYTEHGYASAKAAFETSLKTLGLDYVDLYLIHWPGTSVKDSDPKAKTANPKLRAETWKALEEIYASGKAKNIGVSNYTVTHLKELLAHCKVRPAVNQVEFHPRLFQKELLAFCKQEGIVLQAYSPLARGNLLSNKTVVTLASKHKKTPAQVLLRWGLQHGASVIPKSGKVERIKENADVFALSLDDGDMASLDALNDEYHTCWDPTDMP